MTGTVLRQAGFAALVLSALVFASAPLQAAEPSTSGGLLGSQYWAGFVDFWTGQFKKQNSIVLFTLGIGAVAIFIITRGKWRK